MTDVEGLFLLPQPAKTVVARPDTSLGHVVLLDANNLAMRSFHAAKGKLTAYSQERGETVETGSLHLFCTSLSRWLRDLKPTHFVACWDGGRSLYREGIYPDYKIARRKGRPDGEPPHGPAFALISEFLDLCGIANWYQTGIEADDLIAAGHRIVRENYPRRQITIMSSDKDLLQLLDEHTHQLRFSSYGTPTDMWDRRRVIQSFGYTPEQIPDVMALTGDTSDSVPGARGIGPKKAVKLLEAHGWDLSRAIMAVSDDQVVMVKVSRALVDLLHSPAVEAARSGLDDPYGIPVYDPLGPTSRNAGARLEKLTDFCAQYQLRVLWEGVVERTLWW